VWRQSVVGYAPGTGHAEPSWAAEVPLDAAREIGRRFRQDAIFHVRGDLLSVTKCDDGAPLVPVGAFGERVEVTDWYAIYPRFSRDPHSPWRLLTAERLAAAIDRHLRLDSETAVAGARVFAPVRDFWLELALVETMPDQRSRELAREDLEADSVDLEQLSRFLSDVTNGGWVVRCEVTDSMVSGIWGLAEFTIGNKGYVYYMPDSGIGEVPRIVAAWSPVDNASARRACILSAYAPLWHQIGLPPLLGQWVEGDPAIMHEAVLAALSTPEGDRYWDEVLDVIRNDEDINIASPPAVGTIAGVFALPPRTLYKVLEELSRPAARWSRHGGHTSDELRALVAIYLARIMRSLPMQHL
jgi:hypothetical protein